MKAITTILLLLVILVINCESTQWIKIKPKSSVKPQGRVGHLWTTFPGGISILYGGWDVNTGLLVEDGDGLYQYNYDLNEWIFVSEDPEFPAPLPKPGLCYWSGRGKDDITVFMESEFWTYNVATNKWQNLSPYGATQLIPSGGLRHATCAKSIGSGDVYIWGGYIGNSTEVSHSIFLYSSRENEVYAIDDPPEYVTWTGRGDVLLPGHMSSTFNSFPSDMSLYYSYNRLLNTWSVEDTLDFPLISPSFGVMSKGKYLIHGGFIANNTATNKAFVFQEKPLSITELQSTRGIAPHLAEHKIAVQPGRLNSLIFGGYLLDPFTGEKIPDNELWEVSV